MARLLSLVAPLAAASIAAAYTEVWPMPQSFTTGSTPTVLSPTFSFSCATSVCPDPLPAAFARYTSNILFFAGTPAPYAGNSVTGLVITVGAEANLTLGVSENYTLSVPVQGLATATADTQWGALRAIETFSQLFVWSGMYAANGSQYVIDSAPVVVNDFPRWPWRSLLLDSSRHFLTPSAIKLMLDGMSYSKMSVLHWHIVDDNSWPLYSQTFPNLTLGAYAPDAIYYHEDITSIVQYAWERGIRIVPEFDMPAHADAWGRGFPNLVISCPEGQSLLNPVPASGIYDVVGQLLDEFLPLFNYPDTVHFGGDEVEDLTCWNNSAQVQAFMKSQGLPDVNAVRNYFETQIQQIAIGKAADSMFWEEVYDDAYTREYVCGAL
jgi:hexosaminidase